MRGKTNTAFRPSLGNPFSLRRFASDAGSAPAHSAPQHQRLRKRRRMMPLERVSERGLTMRDGPPQAGWQLRPALVASSSGLGGLAAPRGGRALIRSDRSDHNEDRCQSLEPVRAVCRCGKGWPLQLISRRRRGKANRWISHNDGTPRRERAVKAPAYRGIKTQRPEKVSP
jgi:hypothetical protein